MILTKPELIKAIKKGRLSLKPFSIDQVGPGSIDLTLDKTFRVFVKQKKCVEVKDATDYKKYTKQAIKPNGVLLHPGETILGVTREELRLAPNMCGWLEGRSRFARLGLTIHTTAGFVQPGAHNKQVLEITNIGPLTLHLRPGSRIAQIIIQEAKGKPVYRGRFQKQGISANW